MPSNLLPFSHSAGLKYQINQTFHANILSPQSFRNNFFFLVFVVLLYFLKHSLSYFQPLYDLYTDLIIFFISLYFIIFKNKEKTRHHLTIQCIKRSFIYSADSIFVSLFSPRIHSYKYINQIHEVLEKKTLAFDFSLFIHAHTNYSGRFCLQK